MGGHPLDNPFWHSLSDVQAHVAEAFGPARRYRRDVSVFYAVDELDPASWGALARLAGIGGKVVLARTHVPDPPDGWALIARIPSDQMWIDDDSSGRGLAPAPDWSGKPIRPLTSADVPQMTKLVERAEPGPWRPATIELGGYHGIEDDDGRLLAMAGQRQALDGHIELSAVCTHPHARGRGLGAAVTHHVTQHIVDQGRRPFLHVAHGNDNARRLYERLGFTVRSQIDFVLLAFNP